MNALDTLRRREPTERLPGLAASLVARLERSGLPSERLCHVAAHAIRGECPQCRMVITGEDLLAMTLASMEEEVPNPRLNRLRNGYCARNTCDSKFYDLTFEAVPELDWAAVLGPADSEGSHTLSGGLTDAAEIEKLVETRARFRRMLWLRVVLPLMVLGALLLARHWYRGGAIPFIREPEHFQVDPLPPGAHDWSTGPPPQYPR